MSMNYPIESEIAPELTASEKLRQIQLSVKKSKQSKIDAKADIILEKILTICARKAESEENDNTIEISYLELGVNSEFLCIEPDVLIQKPSMIDHNEIVICLKNKLIKEGFEIFELTEHSTGCSHLGICSIECVPYGILLQWEPIS